MMPKLEVFLQTLIQGFLLGGLYALIGLGMALIMGVMKIINLAHGQLMMVAMYMAFWLFTLGSLGQKRWVAGLAAAALLLVSRSVFRLHWAVRVLFLAIAVLALWPNRSIDPYLSVVIVAPAMFLLGVGIQKYLVNPLQRVDSIMPQNQIILTVGIGMVLTNLATLFFSGDYRSTPVSYATKAWYLADFWRASPIELSISYKELVSFLVAAAITLALWFFLQKTDTGKSIRATAQDRDAALLMGVNVERMRVVTFGIGTALVGAAGCLFIPAYYLFPDLGGQFTTIAFVVTIIGGLGSTTGAIFGGLILAIFESFTATYVGMGWATVGRFVIFVAVLIFLPGGVYSLIRSKKLGK